MLERKGNGSICDLLLRKEHTMFESKSYKQLSSQEKENRNICDLLQIGG